MIILFYRSHLKCWSKKKKLNMRVKCMVQTAKNVCRKECPVPAVARPHYNYTLLRDRNSQPWGSLEGDGART